MAKAARQDGGQAGREEGQPRPGPVSGLGVATAGPEPPRESTLRFPRLGESSSGAGRRWLLLLGTSRPLPPPAGTGRCVLGEWLGTAGGRSVPSEERRLPMGPRAPGVGVSCRLPGRGRPGAGCWSLFFLWFNKYEALRLAHHAGHGPAIPIYSTCSMPVCIFSSPVRQHSYPNELHFPQLYDQDKPSSQMLTPQPQTPVP